MDDPESDGGYPSPRHRALTATRRGRPPATRGVPGWLGDRGAEKLAMAADRPGKGTNMNDLAINVCYLGDRVCGSRPNDDPRSFNDARLVEGLVEEAPWQARLILGGQIKRQVDGNSVHSRLQGAGLVLMVGVLTNVVLAIGEPLEELIELGMRHVTCGVRNVGTTSIPAASSAERRNVRTLVHSTSRVSQSASTSPALRATKPETPYRFQSGSACETVGRPP